MDMTQLVNLILNAGSLVVLLAALMTGFIETKPSVERILKEKDARIVDLKERNAGLNAKLAEMTTALKEAVEANRRLADIEEERLRNWGK